MFVDMNLNYGIIGNCRSAALINNKASIDWCCLPKFDSSSVFAKILDEKKGGGFWMETKQKFHISQTYLKNTCILRTVFRNENHEFEVIDFMPRFIKNKGEFYAPPEIIRIVRPIKGSPEIKFKYDPRLEYAQGETKHVAKKTWLEVV